MKIMDAAATAMNRTGCSGAISTDARSAVDMITIRQSFIDFIKQAFDSSKIALKVS